jgi:hypothetical protein
MSCKGRRRGGALAAWGAIRRALALSPADPQLRARELFLLPSARPPEEAERLLASVYTEIQRGDAESEICFGFLSAALHLAKHSRRREDLLKQALDVATIGQSLPPLWPLDRKVFRAYQLILRELLAGRRPGAEILYRCGLGTWVAGASTADPVSLLAAKRPRLRPARAA